MMTTEIAQFRPLADFDSEANVSDFVSLCRDKLSVFGSDLAFDDFVWDITDHVKKRGKSMRTRIYFSTWESADTPHPVSISEPFVSFAKSYIRYQQAYRPILDITARIVPLRAIFSALCEAGKSSPICINSHILSRASQLISTDFSDERAYRLGRNLEHISDFLTENRLVIVPARWKSPIKRPAGTDRVGKEFERGRQEKLPSTDDLNFVAEAYRVARAPEDIIITSITAMLCCSPDRISEILTLPANCEHADRLPDNKEVYGLRYWPAKGADPMIKWVIPSMVDLAKDALARIRAHTDTARALAQWYEKNPRFLYLPSHLEAYRGSLLSMDQVAEILYLDPDCVMDAISLLKQNKLLPASGAPSESLRVDFRVLENYVLAGLPDNFPVMDKETGMKYSDALCVVHRYAINQQRRTLQCFLEPLTHGQVGNGLGAGVKHGKSSVFSRLGLRNSDGSAIIINSHKFRHYLNTLAMHGGLDELDIAKWSGRRDVRQNRAYDHVSARDKLAMIRTEIGEQTSMFGPLGWAPNIPSISRDEFGTLKVTSAHTTEFGYCIHNFTSTPCQLHLDCLNCNELVCIKGDGLREANIRKQRGETRKLLELARKGESEDLSGANRWVDHQVQTLQRLEELCQIFDDPHVSDGAVIQLKHLPAESRLVQAAQRLGVDLSGPLGQSRRNATLDGAPTLGNKTRKVRK